MAEMERLFWATGETHTGRSAWVLSLQIQRADILEAVIISRMFMLLQDPSVGDSGRAQPEISQHMLVDPFKAEETEQKHTSL